MLTVRLTEHHVLCAYAAHLPVYRFAPFGAAGCVALAGLALLLPGTLDVVVSGVLVSVAALLLAARYLLLPRKAARVYAKRTSYHRPYRVNWNEHGLAVANNSGSHTTYWDDFLNWRSGSGVTLLYLSPTRFHIIPDSAFVSQRALKDFKMLLWEKIGEPPVALAPHTPPIERP